MIITQLKIRNFRNYDSCNISFIPGINVFIGDNAQGKTNLLEAIYFLSSTRSFRDVLDKEMIKEEELFSNLEVIMNEEDKTIVISSVIHPTGKSLLLHKQPVMKASDFIGVLNTVIFSPIDLELFHTSPKVRRRFLDLELGKISKSYLFHLKKYHQLLKERNAYLKQERVDSEYLEVITKQLIEVQKPLVVERQEFIHFINGKINDFYSTLSESFQKVSLTYQTSSDEMDEQELLKKYQKYIEKDKALGQTTVGVHRDDIEFFLENRNVIQYASQGQKRMIVLALKLALSSYIYEKSKRTPILLLDDVLSELDSKRRKNLFKVIPEEIQTFITTTDLDELEELKQRKIQLFQIEQGEVTLYEEVSG